MYASIFNIQQMSFVDGPGIRTTVFFKGCNLQCKWCHNPESQSTSKHRMVHMDKCKHCGKCVEVCPYHLKKCDFCGKCVENCLNDAIEICGKDISVDALLKQILKDQVFYDNSNGGVTFSGGECMLQIEYLAKILSECKNRGIHTAVDTAGNIPWSYFEKVIPLTDMFLYDIKSMNNQIHKKYTGVENILILDNLAKLLKMKQRIWVRVPIIPDVNDTEEEMKSIKSFFEVNGFPEKVELLPYHRMGEHKYGLLGRKAELFQVPSKEKLDFLTGIIAKT